MGVIMRRREAKRIVTILMVIFTIMDLAVTQPAVFGVRTYFGLFPPVFIMPVSAIAIVLYILHLYQHWPLMLAWFKKSPDKNKQRDKTWRAVILIAFILVLMYDISFAWYKILTSEGKEIYSVIDTMRIWSWVAYGFLAIHVWQRWRLTFSYFRRSQGKKAS
jgi:hypothetical protein